MKRNGYTDLVTCPNEDCEAEIEVFYSPGHPGRTYGPIDVCYPADPDELDAPAECPRCGYVFTDRDQERWMDKLAEEYREMESEGRHRYGWGGL